MNPHRSGAALETETPRMQHLAKLLNSLVEGDSAINLVDIQAGY